VVFIKREAHKVDQVKLEINFYSKDKASISLQSRMKQQQFGEIVLFCSFAFRQMRNIGLKHPMSLNLAEELLKNQDPSTPLILLLGPPKLTFMNIFSPLKRDIPDPLKNFISVDTVKLIPPTGRAGQKLFLATLDIDPGRALLHLDPKGFTLLGIGVNYYAPLSVGLLLRHLALSRPAEASFLKSLSRAANLCGKAVLEFEVTAVSQIFLAYQIAAKAISPNA
jgi:hypothetical protein